MQTINTDTIQNLKELATDHQMSVEEFLTASLNSLNKDEVATTKSSNTVNSKPYSYDAIFEYAQDAILILNEDGHYVEVNPAACSLFGYTRDEFLTLHYNDLISEEWRDDLLKAISKFRSDDVIIYETMMRHKSQKDIHVEISSVRHFVQGFHFAIIRDLSERKENERLIKKNEQFLQTIYDGTQTSIFIVDIDEAGQYSYGGINRAHEEATGIKNDDIVGKSPYDLIALPPEDINKIVSNYDRCVASEGDIQYEEELIFQGEKLYWLTTLSPLKNDAGRIYRLIGMSLDITQQYQAHDALHKAEMLDMRLSLSEQIDATKRDLLSTITHEFHTPIAVIQSSHYLLTRALGDNTSEKMTKYLDRLFAQATIMTHLMQRINLVNKHHHMDQDIVISEVNISDFIEAIADDIRMSTSNEIEIRTSFNLQEKTCLIVAELLRQIMTNLLSNSAKYASQNPLIQVICHSNEDILTITVEDNGIGIVADELATIFEPFQRGQNVGDVAGTGIGLSTVKQNVDLLGGEISVQSTENIGTTFTVILPILK